MNYHPQHHHHSTLTISITSSTLTRAITGSAVTTGTASHGNTWARHHPVKRQEAGMSNSLNIDTTSTTITGRGLPAVQGKLCPPHHHPPPSATPPPAGRITSATNTH